MDNTNIALRMSAQEIQKLILAKTKLHEFIWWLGKIASGQGTSENKMAEALSKLCNAQKPTIRRWINGESKPNGTNMLMIYTSVLAQYYSGDQAVLVHDFLKDRYPDLFKQIFAVG